MGEQMNLADSPHAFRWRSAFSICPFEMSRAQNAEYAYRHN